MTCELIVQLAASNDGPFHVHLTLARILLGMLLEE